MTKVAGSAATRDDDAVLAPVLDRLIEAFHPQRIYLFGSRARGDSGPESDYDLMLVMPDDAPRDLLDPRSASRAVVGARVSIDVILFRRSKFDGQLHLKASLPATVARE